MKTKYKVPLVRLFGIVVLVALIGFSMVSCGGSSSTKQADNTATFTGEADGETYTLEITGAARYAAQKDDDYELTKGSNKSKGKVDSVSGSELTLKPSNSATKFTANVSGNNLSQLEGTITWTTGETILAPGTLTIRGGGDSIGSLNLSGQVYNLNIDFDAISDGSGNMYKYTPSTVSMPLQSIAGGQGSITNGRLSYSVGTPPASSLEPVKLDLDDLPYDIYKDARVTPSDAKGVDLDFGEDTDLSRMLMKVVVNSSNSSAYTMTMNYVWYSYVDKTCTLTATGKTVDIQGTSVTYPSLNITLNQGWNILNMKMTATERGGTLRMDRGDLPLTVTDCPWVLNAFAFESDY